jgi:hypothetical protein
MDEKQLHKRALYEKETNAYKCIENASTHNEAKTFFVPNWFMTQPLSNSHYSITWVDWIFFWKLELLALPKLEKKCKSVA